MKMTVFNTDTQLYELDHFGIEYLENAIQKLGIIEDLLEEYNIYSIQDLREYLHDTGT